MFAGSDGRAASPGRIVEVSDAGRRDSPTAAVGDTGSGAESVEELPKAAEMAAISLAVSPVVVLFSCWLFSSPPHL